MSNSYVRANLGTPRRSHVWRSGTGEVVGTVDLGDEPGSVFYVGFTNPADARAMAAELVAIAEQMEKFPPEETGSATGAEDSGA